MDFDYKTYISNYDDLKHFKTPQQALSHYLKYGKKEGRTYKKLLSQSLPLQPVPQPLTFKVNQLNEYKTFNIKYIDLLLNSIEDYKFLDLFKIVNSPSLSTSTSISTFNHDEKIIYFVYDDYIKIYPYYEQIFKNDKLECYRNYLKFSKKQKLIPNLELFQIIQDYQINKQKSLIKDFDLKYNNERNVELTFSILIRTHDRKDMFNDLINIINNQNFPNIDIYVSYDNLNTQKYVKEHINSSNNLPPLLPPPPNIYLIDLINEKIHPNQYIDIIYDNIKNKNSWILILDDDDKLYSNNVLNYLSKMIVKENMLLIWKFFRNDQYIYPKDYLNVELGEIATCSYLFHYKKYIKNCWNSTPIGDYDFFNKLHSTYEKKDIIFLDHSLTGVNYNNKISGFTCTL